MSALFQEHGNHAASAAQNIAVPDAAEARRPRSRVGIALHKEFLRAQLGRSVEIDGVDCLVRAEGHHLRHTAIDGRIDDVLGPQHIGLDGLERIVFAGRHLFERGGVYHQIHGSLEGSPEAPRVPDIADEEAQPRIGVLTAHLGLLQLVPAEDDEPARVVAAISTNFRPNDPVPPVTRIVLSSRNIALASLSWVSWDGRVKS